MNTGPAAKVAQSEKLSPTTQNVIKWGTTAAAATGGAYALANWLVKKF